MKRVLINGYIYRGWSVPDELVGDIEGMVFLPVAVHFEVETQNIASLQISRNFRFSEFLLLSRFNVKLNAQTGGL